MHNVSIRRTSPNGPAPPRSDAPPALLVGGWGDVLAGLGRLRSLRPGQLSSVVYFGFDPAVAEFISLQSGVREVFHELPLDQADYLRAAVAPAGLAARLGAEDFSPPFDRHSLQEPCHWHGAVLDMGARAWARERCQELPAGQRYLLFPRSTQNTSWAGHWPYWERLIRWLVENTPHQYLLCGQGWRPEVQHDHLHNFVNQTETLAQVLALAEACDGVLATSTAVALWSRIQRIPAAVFCTDQDVRDTYWHRWLEGRDALLVENHATFEHGLKVAKDLLQRPERKRRALPRVARDIEIEVPSDGRIRLCVPPGIGDIAWVYAAGLHCLGERTGREVLLYLPDDRRDDLPVEHNMIVGRSEPFIDLLPGVKFGGYAPRRTGWEVVNQSVPSEWPAHMGYGPLRDTNDKIINVSANLTLEMGKSLADVFPMPHWETGEPLLPKEYHFPLNVPEEVVAEAEALVAELPAPVMAIYVSNRDKEQYDDWRLWTADMWLQMMEQSGAKSFVILGAEWDRDKTDDVVQRAEKKWPVLRLVGRELGLVLEIMRRCAAGCYFPSGMGIMANVLRQPAAMLLPYHLRHLTNFADPADVESGRYRCFPSRAVGEPATVKEVAAFLRPFLEVQPDGDDVCSAALQRQPERAAVPDVDSATPATGPHHRQRRWIEPGASAGTGAERGAVG